MATTKAPTTQVKNSKHMSFFANGVAVGLARVQSVKSTTNQKLQTVAECGNPDVVEYSAGVRETDLSLAFLVFGLGQLAVALGLIPESQALSYVGEVPAIPEKFDVVEKLIKVGTENTPGEVAEGFSIYQGIQVDKETFDTQIDKIVMSDITCKAKPPRRYMGAKAIPFDKFTGDGSLSTFVLTGTPMVGLDGNKTIRVENPLGIVLAEGTDYTVVGSGASPSLTFTNGAPASGTKVLAIYASST